MRTALHVTVWDDGPPGAPSVVLVHGSGEWGAKSFAAQQSLASEYQLLVPDRRGYGASPEIERSDYDVDADDVVELLGEGAHLVGHSYGAVVAMLAAGRRPHAVRSLALIEPGCYQLAADDPVVAEAIERNREGMAAALSSGLLDVPDEDLVRISYESAGMPVPDITPELKRAARSALLERPVWEADCQVPVEPLRTATWPKLVITGTWETATESYRRAGGEPLMACARVTAERIGAELLQVSRAAHFVHSEQPETVNRALRQLWRSA